MWVAQVPALSSTFGASFCDTKFLSSCLRTARRPLLVAVPTMPAAKPTTANTNPCKGCDPMKSLHDLCGQPQVKVAVRGLESLYLG